MAWRFTHVYPDGPAPYYTILAPARRGSELEQWDEIKAAASEAVIAAGGTITHHHAVGRDHRPWYDRQRPDRFAARAARRPRRRSIPRAILNPGVLIDPLYNSAGREHVCSEPWDPIERSRTAAQSSEPYSRTRASASATQRLGHGALACPVLRRAGAARRADTGDVAPRAVPFCLEAAPLASSCVSTSSTRPQRRRADRARLPVVVRWSYSAATAFRAARSSVRRMPRSKDELTLAEAARQAGVSRSTLRRWGERGVIPAYRGRWTPGGGRPRPHRRAPARAGALARGDQEGGRGRPACVRLRRRAVSARARAAIDLSRRRRSTGLEPALIERIWRALGFPPWMLDRLDERGPRGAALHGGGAGGGLPARRVPSDAARVRHRCARSPTPRRACSASTCTSR